MLSDDSFVDAEASLSKEIGDEIITTSRGLLAFAVLGDILRSQKID
jgi:hypothetical protein